MKNCLILGTFILSLNLKAVIIGSNDLRPVSSTITPSKVKELAKSVGHVKTSMIFPSKCSGFLVSESLFLTTTDCVPAYLTTGRIRVYFNNLEDKNEDLYRVDEIVMRNGTHKLVLLRLKKSPGKKQGYLKLNPDLTGAGESLSYIENDSDSFVLQYMTEPCEAFGYAGDGLLAHDCDTTLTQGAPLINEDNEVVGMQYGFYFSSPVLNNAISSSDIEPLIRVHL